ncbi:MAG: 30S ribosomal protein S12 methylthiotransferase RimO [Oscillospiraceae bacterium]|nr:30S ribosomal protein S12 methylthiotransferase RimO [Oscillospiraceae bacterium]
MKNNKNNKFKIGFISLGCPKNLIDTEIMLKILADDGYEITTEDIEADIIIVNTCAFVESAKKEAIENILDVAWLKKNGGKKLKGIIVCGCLAERYREEVLAELPEVDALVGVFSIHDILEAVRHIEKKLSGKYISLKPGEGFELGGDRILTTPEYFAYIKIAEGCDNCCSYCVIPKIRSSFKARKTEDIIKEAKELASLGVVELAIVAQDTTRYENLPELLTGLCKIEGIKWIRLLYCYPDKITDELIETIKNNDKIVKYIDMPIQHINDDILAAMNRTGGSAAIRSAILRLRAHIPNITIRTTVITGFPGETREMFSELCDFLQEARFERLGAFAYSAEEGTPAAGFAKQLPQKEKERRQRAVMALQGKISRVQNQEKIGKTIKVLCEGFDKVSGVYYGRSEADAPEIDGKVYFAPFEKVQSPGGVAATPFEKVQSPGGVAATPFEKGAIGEGEFVEVKITKVIDYDLYGEAQ